MYIYKNLKLVREQVKESISVGGGATGVSSVPGPTGGKATLPASKNQSEPMKKVVDPNNPGEESTDTDNNTKPTGDQSAKNRASVASKISAGSMKEEVTKLFAGQEISEELLDRTVIVFEAALGERINLAIDQIDEVYAAALEEHLKVVHDKLVEDIDAFADSVAETFMEDNKLEIETSIRGQLAESFLKGLKSLFEEHYVTVADEEIDVVTEMASRIDELEAQVASITEERDTFATQVTTALRNEIVVSMSEGLTATQVEKFNSLVEAVEFVSEEDFKKRVSIIKENYFGSKPPVVTPNASLTEETNQQAAKPAVSSVSKYLDALNRTAPKK